jgi:hypothetical protein
MPTIDDDQFRDAQAQFAHDIDEHSNKVKMLNEEQRAAFDMFAEALECRQPLILNLDAPGGTGQLSVSQSYRSFYTGKTFLLNTMLEHALIKNRRVIAVASSGVAVLLLREGRTAHSAFKVPIPCFEDSTCAIGKQSDWGRILAQVDFVLWDEASLMHRNVFDTVDRMFRDICECDAPFGGKIVCLAGDFRQALPVVPRAGRAGIVESTVQRCSFWKQAKKYHLQQNMRIRDACDNVKDATSFNNWLLALGNGRLPMHKIGQYDDCIALPSELLTSSEEELIAGVFDDFENTEQLQRRAIVCPKNEHCNRINALIAAKRRYVQTKSSYSVDQIVDGDPVLYPVEFLNTLDPSGMPPHVLTLQKGTPVILLRNLQPKRGLCNGTRLIIKSMHDKVLDCEIITGPKAGNREFIPKLWLTPSDTGLNVAFKRYQFPVRVSYAMTINK